MKKYYYLLLCFLNAALCLRGQSQHKRPVDSAPKKYNVLFLISDDLRTDMGIYGHPLAQTPNLDRLAAKGVWFKNAYCQYPLCNPSRSSLLTGKRPTTSGLYGNREWFNASFPDWISLPKYFKQNGYTTIRSGKVFHGGIDDTEAWDIGGEKRQYGTVINGAPPAAVDSQSYWQEYSNSPPRIDPYAASTPSDKWAALTGEEARQIGDTKVADRAIQYLENHKQTEQPFFLACGFSKPHTPFVAPKEFFDLYDLDSIALPPDFSSMPGIPVGFPAGSIRRRNADFFVNRTASPQEAKEYIRAYLACISYMDWNVGRVLKKLEESGLKENTIVVFWSDHGYQLGEKGKWSKAGSLWEQGTRVPFIIYDPRAEGNGQPSPRVVELLDIYPTLVDLCGLPGYEGLEGKSLKPLLYQPDQTWERPAYTVWSENGKGVTGITVRTEKWRYAEFFGHGAGKSLTNALTDPHQMINLANDQHYADIVDYFHRLVMQQVNGKVELPPTDK
ncbi:sulfatase [Sphingobacterium sp. UBA7625]|uniref:sulfatase n=1 Tax=Sphingobacterium sp. UBA7625 TaxID=1947522 RepID=UPI00257DCED2|nr:sulfatase [Sphingobacterium sp. UBA7625]